jgi:hypothetical protein
MLGVVVAEWRAEVESVAFRPVGHEGVCVVHRRAFETLMGRRAGPEECVAYLQAHLGRFERAAATKIARAALGARAIFHLNSRDVARVLRPAQSV